MMQALKKENYAKSSSARQRRKFKALHEFIGRFRIPATQKEIHDKMTIAAAEAGPDFEAWWRARRRSSKR